MRKLIILVGLLSAAVLLPAQESVFRTDTLQRDTINGVPVFVYHVQKAEGLYRISHNFGITQEDLLTYNPVLKTEGLKLGQKIYVPVVEQNKLDTADYITHTLQPKETLYGLSRKYGVSQDEIKRLNPEITKRMEIGKTLIIKAREKTEFKPAATEQAAETTKPADATREPQPTPAETAKKEDRPTAENTENKQETEIAEQKTDNIQTSEQAGEDLTPYISELPLRLAYLLPLQVDAVKRDANMNRFVDFYHGALLAIYEAQQQGQQFEIFTYDAGKTDVALQQILQRGELQMMDAIIGPAYPAQVTYAGLFAKQNRIPLLVPFTQKVTGVELNPYIMQFNPTPEMHAAALVKSLLPKKDSIRFVIIDADSKDVPATVKTLREAVREAEFDIATTSVRDILADSLSPALDNEKENYIIFSTEKFSAINVLMPKILEQKQGRQITLCGYYAWAEEKLMLPMVYTSVFHAPEENALQRYEDLYTHYFGKNLSGASPRYDMLGYDLTRALISSMIRCQQTRSAQNYNDCMSEPRRGLQSDVAMPQVAENGGRINSCIEVIRK